MGFWSRLGRTIHSGHHTSEIDEELRFHLEMEMAGGHDRREARLRLGSVARIREETRGVGILEWLDSAVKDARYGVRQLRRTPALTLAVVLSLAVGIGANTAIFSLVDAAILRPLPVHDPNALRVVEWTNDGFPKNAHNINGDYDRLPAGRFKGSSVPAYLYRRLAAEQTVFQALIGIADADAVAVAFESAPAEQVSLQYVSGNFFQGVGSAPVLGRAFRDDEDRVGEEPVVIVSHRFWMRHVAKGSVETTGGLLNSRVRINNMTARVVGVAAPGFFGLRAGEWTDVYAPLAAKVAFRTGQAAHEPRIEDDFDWWVRMVGRLKPDVPEDAARTQIAGQFRLMAAPEGVTLEPTKIPELMTVPGRHGLDALNDRDTSALWTLMVLVAVLLLIVCANVANLLLARAVGRDRESSVRLALGAARMRLFRQHLIESAVLALLGGGAGLWLGFVLAESIHALFETGRGPGNAFDLQVDLRVLSYTGALSILTAFLFGLAPAMRAGRAELGDSLKSQTRSVVRGGLGLPRALVSIQIALCLTALVAAGLLGRSLANLKWTDLGFARENLVYASVSPARAGYPPERMGPYVDRVREELTKLPGVVRVSPVGTRLLSGGGNNGRMNLPGRPWDDTHRANLNKVADGYFETMGMPVIAGRAIERSDIRPDAEAVVVDEVFARMYFPNENAVGRRLGLDGTSNNNHVIVGVVGNSRYNSLRGEMYPTIYEPYSPGGTVHFAIRTGIDGSSLGESVRQAVASVDPAVPLTEFHTQSQLIDRLLRTERLLGILSGAFGVVALTLSAIGLGGLLAYAVARRTNEIGVRMALGAGARDVVRMVLRDSLCMVGIGVLVGLPCAYAIGKMLKTALFRLEPLDPWTTAVSLTALVSVALAAAWIPARRASRIDPVVALRQE
jgi:predicted permease